MTLTLVFFLTQDAEHRFADTKFPQGLRESLAAYGRALEESKQSRFGAALEKLRPLLANPTGYEEAKIIETIYDRFSASQKDKLALEYYPFKLAGRCRLELARNEAKEKALEDLRQARDLLMTSIGRFKAASSKEILAEVNDLEIRKEIDSEDFTAAAAAVGTYAATLGPGVEEALRGQLQTRQKNKLDRAWQRAEAALENFNPARNAATLADDLNALIPSRVTDLSPELEWIRDLARTLVQEKVDAAPYVERALKMEQRLLLDVALGLHFDGLARHVREGVDAAKSGSLGELTKRAGDVRVILAGEEAQARALTERLSKGAPRSREEILKRFANLHTERMAALRLIEGQIPSPSPALEEIVQALGTYDSAVYSTSSRGSYGALQKRLDAAIQSVEFARWHREARASAHYLKAVLTALEGVRLGDSAERIRTACEESLRKVRELGVMPKLQLPLPSDVKAAVSFD